MVTIALSLLASKRIVGGMDWTPPNFAIVKCTAKNLEMRHGARATYDLLHVAMFKSRFREL